MLQSRLIVNQALDAVVRSQATDEAYDVLARSGYYELFQGVVYRSEEYMSIAVSTARQIITEAKADEVYEGEMPEDDASAIKAAEELIEMAEQAWASSVRGPEVEKILRLAASEGNGDGSTGESEAEQTHYEPPSETPSDDNGGDDDDVGSVPEFFSDLPENLKKIEPYEGYGDDRVRDITEAINWYLDDPTAEQTEEQKRELLQNVWVFESAHKNRSRILKFVIEAAKRHGFITEDEQQPPTQDERAPAESASETTEAPSEPEAKEEKAEDEASAYQKLIDLVDNELRKERVDIPAPPTEDAPELPWRWNEISDQSLQDFHMQFASLAYYKGYQRSREDRISFYCKDAADEISREMMRRYPKTKDFKVTVAEAEIESNPSVKRWRKLQRRHEAFAHQARQEMDGYYKLVEALSRLESMRHNAWERGRR